jgi:membrane-associated phospholipid phosphatase
MWIITSLGLGHIQLIIIAGLAFCSYWRRFIFWPAIAAFASSGLASIVIKKIQLIIIAGLAFCSYWRHFIFWPAIAAFASSGLISIVIKKLVGGNRPSVYYPQWVAPDEFITGNSFASGHTITSFAIAVVIFYYTRSLGKRWIGWLALVIAALVAFSRVYRGVHWPSDVIIGALIGSLCGYVCARLFDKKSRKADTEPSPDFGRGHQD